MAKRAMHFVLAIVAVLAASLAAGTASAATISVSPGGSITATSLGRLTLTGRGGIELSINCRVTLRGTIGRSIADAARSNVGSITEARSAECSSGTLTPLVESRTAWPLTLNEAIRLEGGPQLLNINIGNAKFQAEGILGQTCLYEGTLATQLEAESELKEEVVRTRLLRIIANSETLTRRSGLCPERSEVRGNFEFTRQTLTRVPNWVVEQTAGEDGAGHRTLISNFTYIGGGTPTINPIGYPMGWTKSADTCLGRTFTRNEVCNTTLVEEASAINGNLTLYEGFIARSSIDIRR